MKYLLFIILISSTFLIGKDIFALRLPGCTSNNILLDYKLATNEVKYYFGLLVVNLDSAQSVGGCSNASDMGTEFQLEYSNGKKIGNIEVYGKTQEVIIEYNHNKDKYLLYFYKFLLFLIITSLLFLFYKRAKNNKKKTEG